MIKFFGIELNLRKRVLISLTYIHGIGLSISKKICLLCNIDFFKRIFELNNYETNCLKKNISKYITGDNLKILVKYNIKKLVDINCYRGSRHKKNLPVRGQRTRNNSKTVKNIKNIFKNEFKKN